MPGKVDPVIPEVVTQVAAQVVNDAAITIGGMNGHFELNVCIPADPTEPSSSRWVCARRRGSSPRSASTGSRRTGGGAEADAELHALAATALNPFIGYDKAAEMVKTAAASGRSLREVALEAGVEESVLNEALRPARWPSRTGKAVPAELAALCRGDGPRPPFRALSTAGR